MERGRERRLLERLDELAAGFRERGDAIAVLGFGSVGLDLQRLDEHSDLDFFVVTDDGAKERYSTDLDWLDAVAPVVYSFPNSADGRKILWSDGLYAEYAIYTLEELRAGPRSRIRSPSNEEQRPIRRAGIAVGDHRAGVRA